MTARRCQVGGHALLTKSYLVYLGIAHGDEQERYRLRFCRPHAAAIYEDLAQFEVNAEDGTLSGGDDSLSKCLSCGEPVDDRGWYAYVTSYPTKNERKDYWSRLHVDCRVPELLVKGPYAE